MKNIPLAVRVEDMRTAVFSAVSSITVFSSTSSEVFTSWKSYLLFVKVCGGPNSQLCSYMWLTYLRRWYVFILSWSFNLRPRSRFWITKTTQQRHLEFYVTKKENSTLGKTIILGFLGNWKMREADVACGLGHGEYLSREMSKLRSINREKEISSSLPTRQERFLNYWRKSMKAEI